MKLYYYKSPTGNFGDDLNAWLWEELLPGYFKYENGIIFSGIGTIISADMPTSSKTVIFGSGVGYGYPPMNFGDNRWDVRFVRGPLSAKVLSLPANKYITDSAILVSKIEGFEPLPENERSGIIFVPHHHALHTGQWHEVCKSVGIEFIDPTQDSKYVIQKIRKSKLVLADAMHAAIIADSLRVPWIPLVTSNQINTFKWIDWTLSVKLEYSPSYIGPSSMRECLRNKFLHLYGESFYIKSLNADDSINCFYKQRDILSNKWWPIYSKIIRRCVYTAPNLLLKKIEQFSSPRWDEKYISLAKKKILDAMKRAPMLSSDDVYQSNLNKILNEVECVRKMYK
ncbi:TPA: hypothetical protein PBP03_002702 [Escherichia coli]|nr:polysaccharide pyruvyl transferase family protein [Escherichia coli]EFK6612847.1 polysaccharide pyruvyl transferase family protein [Escherichia coli]EFK6619377.1 polysaccharide pyruvyl transferase family protein [Escherichia coli]EFK6626242.1 polysaccharide pyruvyl transferase family protein [Escherichia coli]EGN2330659.1 polysaccharide pyruvyl transferase family protein [Escherichia coli]EHW7197912.1 hypothetical protein [Escherichia coli]